MSDDKRNDRIEWGVRPLPKEEREKIRSGVGTTPKATPTKPPSGGSAVPPPLKK